MSLDFCLTQTQTSDSTSSSTTAAVPSSYCGVFIIFHHNMIIFLCSPRLCHDSPLLRLFLGLLCGECAILSHTSSGCCYNPSFMETNQHTADSGGAQLQGHIFMQRRHNVFIQQCTCLCCHSMSHPCLTPASPPLPSPPAAAAAQAIFQYYLLRDSL